MLFINSYGVAVADVKISAGRTAVVLAMASFEHVLLIESKAKEIFIVRVIIKCKTIVIVRLLHVFG